MSSARTDENNNSEDIIKNLKAQVSKRHKKLKLAEQEVTELRQKNEELTITNEQLNTEITGLNQRLADLAEKIHLLEGAAEEAQIEYNKCHRDKSVLTKDIERSQKINQNLREQLKNALAANEQLTQLTKNPTKSQIIDLSSTVENNQDAPKVESKNNPPQETRSRLNPLYWMGFSSKQSGQKLSQSNEHEISSPAP